MNKDFRNLKRHILIQSLGIIGVCLMLGLLIQVVLIDGVLQAPFADGFIHFCERVFRMGWYEAQELYARLFRRNKPVLMMFGLLLLLAAGFYYSLARTTKYFRETVNGIDSLLDDGVGVSTFSPEMAFMKEKIDSVKRTLQKRERDAAIAEQRKNDLVVYLAHDIKTPLTSVIGYLNLLDESRDMDADKQAKSIQVTLQNALRLEQLVNEFFDITRFNLQTIELDIAPINLTMMLAQLADEFHPIFDEKGLTPHLDVPEGLHIEGDAEKLARVFRNILKNAAAFGERGTALQMTAARLNGEVRVSIGNVGTIIPPDQLENIFEKFYRLDAARRTQTGGAGLGLAIAREIAAAHGGRIAAESGENRTVFTVTLPIDSRP